MAPLPKTFRSHAGISDLCTVFHARLHHCWEEGVPRHRLHRPCQPIVIDEKGRIAPDIDVHLTVVLGLERYSPLHDFMEEDLRTLKMPPFESLFLDIPIEDPRDPTRAAFMRESAERFLDLAEAGAPVLVVAMTHRRRIGGSIVLRHYPVAVFDNEGALEWVHPAGPAYGLIRPGFPAHQQIRRLGRRRGGTIDLNGLSRLDPETGLPVWFRQARDQLITDHGIQYPAFEEVIGLEAESLLVCSFARDAEHALREATVRYLRGFERFFGQGGLDPVPGVLEIP
jgi:hypothetical protein